MPGVTTSCDADDGDDEFADAHSDSAPDEEGTAAEFVDGPECYWCRDGVDWIMLVMSCWVCVTGLTSCCNDRDLE